MIWRVLPFAPHDPFKNLALDEVLLDFVGKGLVKPTMRFYGWTQSAVIVGYFQKISNEVQLRNCDRDNVLYVRRISGGGAVYQDVQGGLTYTVAVSPDYFSSDISCCYQKVGEWIICALDRLGILGEFHPVNDILVNGKKISGNALTVRNNCMLVHGTLLYTLSPKKMFSYLRVSKEKVSDKLIQNFRDRVTCVMDHTNTSQESVIKALTDSFTLNKDYVIEQWTKDELRAAEDLVVNKFSTKEWIFRR